MHRPLGSAARSYPVHVVATFLFFSLAAAACGGGKANPPPGVNPSRGGTGGRATGGANGGGGIMANGGAGNGGQGGEAMGTGGASTGGAGGGSAPDVPASETDPVDMTSDESVTPDLAPDVVCMNPCVVGRKRCTANGQVEECKMDGACPVWGEATACPAPTVCMTMGNNAGCQCPTAGPDACRIGERRCMTGMLQECKAGAPGTCPAWAAPTACAANRECTDPPNATADCRCKAVCTLGAKRCAGGALEECVAVDTCPAWKRTECTAPQSCTVVAGVAGCNCPAESCRIGERRCSPTNPEHVQECRGPAGGCGTWQHLKTCPTPQQACSATPTPDCRCKETCTVGDQRCSEGKRQTCRAMAGGCNQFVDDLCTVGACEMTSPRTARCVCPGGSDACVAGEQRCGPGRVHQTCEVAAAGCGTFKNTPCSGERICNTTDGSAPDRRATCDCPSSACTINSARCNNSVNEICRDKNNDQCGEVFEPGGCTPPMHTCHTVSGRSMCGVAPCANPVCTVGDLKCMGNNTIFRCEASSTPGGCPEWKMHMACGSGVCTDKRSASGGRPAVPETTCCPRCTQKCNTMSGGKAFLDPVCSFNAAGCFAPLPPGSRVVCPGSACNSAGDQCE